MYIAILMNTVHTLRRYHNLNGCMHVFIVELYFLSAIGIQKALPFNPYGIANTSSLVKKTADPDVRAKNMEELASMDCEEASYIIHNYNTVRMI